jgi:hypothetical protein
MDRTDEDDFNILGGEEKVKARREDRRANHETAPTIKQG